MSKTEPSGRTKSERRAAKASRAASKSESEPEAKPAPSGPFPLAAKPAYALAFASGFLYFLAFPGVDVWPLAFVALAPLAIALRGQTAKRAAGLGWLAGFTMTMFGFYWLLEMLRVFSNFPTAVCIVFMALLCAYQAGRIALMGWLCGRAERKGWPFAPVFALAFAASELVYPLLFPWYYGATTHKVPLLMQTAELGGPVLVGLVLVAANLALAELVVAWLAKRAPSRPVLAVGLAAPLFAIAFGAWRLRAVDQAMAAAPAVQVGIAQPNLPLMQRAQSIPINTRLTRELAAEGAELVVWSEATVTRSFSVDTYKETVPTAISKALGVPTVLGGVLYEASAKPGERVRRRSFNVALMADEKGAITGRYDKQYLLAFGEYLPFGETFPVLYDWSPNSGRFSAGTSLDPMPFREYRISSLICYEDILPSFVNGMVRHANPHLLVNLTNDSWFGDTTEPWIHFALAKMRAIEHRRFLVRATNSGVSGVVDANGRERATSGTFRVEKLRAEVRMMQGRTAYEILGDVPLWLGTLAVAAMAFVPRTKLPFGAPPVAPALPDGPASPAAKAKRDDEA